MKIVTFVPNSLPSASSSGSSRPGLLLNGNEVIDLTSIGYDSVQALIEAGPKALLALADLASASERLPLSGVRLLAPLPNPPRIFAVGLNYSSHAAESKMTVQKVPTVFMKLSSSVTGPDTEVILPSISQQPDYEAELALVIGRPGYQIEAGNAMEHVFGYTILNDVSARDIQLATSQWTLGKSFPTFTPFGPAITTADEIADPHALDIKLTVDGETLQSANTRDLIFRIPQIIEHISSLTPLQAGDIISTGTPEGVGLGRTPQRWLRPGEEMVVTIPGLGELRNRTVAEGQHRS